VDIEIGQRLKSIRTRLNLSQRQLARQSGVANATISQVEAGKLNPTVSMLKKVLDGSRIGTYGNCRRWRVFQAGGCQPVQPGDPVASGVLPTRVGDRQARDNA